MKLLKLVGIAVLLLVLIGALVFFGIVPTEVAKRLNSVVSPPPYKAPERARELHQSLFIADLHADSLLWNRDLLDYGTDGHVDIPRLVKGNVALQAFTVVTKLPRGYNIESTSSDAFDLITLLSFGQLRPVSTWTSLKERALYQAHRLHETAAASNGKLVLVKSSNDLEQYVEQRKNNPDIVGGFLGIEGAHCLEGKLENVDVLFEAGFRMIGLTHFFDNELGGSAHASPDLMDDVLDIAARPIVVSHTGLRGTCDNPRNLHDEPVRRIAQTGGVIGIGYWSTAVCGTDAESIAKAIRYTADLVGVDHVALGSDFDGGVPAVFDTTGIVQITEALLSERFSEEDIGKIMGENVLRVLKEALPRE